MNTCTMPVDLFWVDLGENETTSNTMLATINKTNSDVMSITRTVTMIMMVINTYTFLIVDGNKKNYGTNSISINHVGRNDDHSYDNNN